MSEHAGTRKATKRSTGRVRALLSLGVALGLGTVGTFAYWTDDVVISGSTFTTGTLDLKVNDLDAYPTTTLTMNNMIPGNTSAEVLTVKNAGNVPLKYTLTGGLTGTDAPAFNTAGALKLTILLGGTKSGTGNTSTCTGGTSVGVSNVALTNVPSTAIIATRRPASPLAPTLTEALCFQVSFDAAAPQTLANAKVATATFTATGTVDVS